jgi:hypothetical protein
MKKRYDKHLILNTTSLLCSQCGHEIGKIVIIGNEELINLSGLILKEAHGVCVNCGCGFHYSLSEKRLKEIIKICFRDGNLPNE